MTLLSNVDYKQRFSSIAKIYEKISNQYTVNRRAESFKISPSELILEVGSGTGMISDLIDRQIICSDISYEMCKESAKKHMNVICCDAEKLPIRENILDGIISAEVVYYLNNPNAFIEDSTRILKKDGKLMITIFNQKMQFIDSIRSFLRIFNKKMYFDDGHELMKYAILKKLLEKNNFRITYLKKNVIFPFKSLHKINLLFEKTGFSYFCFFIIVEAVNR
jgi:ubiquinone/menaquinone biosynthesis C-methylase UbiE